MTPEGKVKHQIKGVLKEHQAYFHMPVQNGYGSPTLDFTGCHKGIYYTIEAKAKGEDATPRQRNTMREVISCGGSVFFIDGPGCDDMLALIAWLGDPKPEVIGPDAHKQLQTDYESLLRRPIKIDAKPFIKDIYEFSDG